MIKISIIVVTYNSSKTIDVCISKLINQDINGYKAKIIVIDNDSTDDTILKLRKFGKKIKIIKNKQNLGFSKAVNIGIKSCDSDFYILVNPDAFLEEKSIISLVNCSNNHQQSICGGKTLSLNNETQGDHFRRPTLLIGLFDFTNLRKVTRNEKWHDYFYYIDTKVPDRDIDVDCVTGGFMLIPKSVIKRIGLMDEGYFMYLEDVDYCCRAKDNGVRVVYCPSAIAKHIGGASSNNKEKSNIKAWLNSRSRFFANNFKLIDNLIIQPIFFIDRIFIESKIIYENLHNPRRLS